MIDDEARSTYLNILAEVKHRLDVVSHVLDGSLPIVAKAAEELCILQFRFVAELIAIGCLVLHEDLALSKSGVLAKAWNAGQIFKRLSTLHPDFYPKPLKGQAADKFKWEAFDGPFMTQAKIVTAYNEFGAALHRGTVRRIFREDPPLDFPKVLRRRLEFMNLLNRHTVISADREHICHFNMCPIGEHPTCTLFKRLPDGSPANDEVS